MRERRSGGSRDRAPRDAITLRTTSSALILRSARRRGLGARVATRTPRRRHMDKRGKDGILTHTDPKHDMPEDADTPTDA